MAYLMDLLADELGEQASKIYRHNLMSFLETAIRSSNAQFHGLEYLNRLDIKLLEASPGDRGWEIF
jgi:gamma-tubulin complex component 3